MSDPYNPSATEPGASSQGRLNKGRLIECVPNFSEGRDAATIQALVAAMSGIPGAAVLDVHSDADHNRTVVTLAGEPGAVAEAALRGIGEAAAKIDLTRQSGVHPRIGSADVLPFVPIEGATLEECAALTHRVGVQVWERYRVPVYFYGAAATRSDRIALENVRRGQFEGLREAALLFPNRAPDVGGPCLHPSAGAVAIGARNFLIACNVNLETGDLAMATRIARAIRASSGGLPGVKAMGVILAGRGQVQVSMNLTDFRQTSLAALFERVHREAARCGVAVAADEIVGLVPRAAAQDAGFDLRPEQILENRLAAALSEERQAPAKFLLPINPSNDAVSESILSKGLRR